VGYAPQAGQLDDFQSGVIKQQSSFLLQISAEE
jgi:hypothetical protein